MQSSQLLLKNINEFDVKFECGIGWNYPASTSCSVGQFRWNDEGAFAAHTHALNPFVPSLDDHAFTQEKFNWGVAIKARVKLRTRFFIFISPTGVVNAHLVFGFGDLALANVGV